MQMRLIKSDGRKPISTLSVVHNFRQVIETKDISLMGKELYQFLNLYCGFIAHYDISGFKAVYSPPREFAQVFIRHFDREHRYFNGSYSCHEEPYRETDYTKAEIKQEFNRIVETHKDSIGRWANNRQREERLNVYKMLKEEFQGTLEGLKIHCKACDNHYEVNVLKEGENTLTDLGIIYCLFCGQQIRLF
jgi:hypothetical protein